MIRADQLIQRLDQNEHTFVSGVPCSYLKPFINRVIDSEHLNWVGAASEGEAVGINLGAYLAGRKTLTLCQNSGLGNTVNPLTSLNYPFQVPTLLIVTWRGEPGRPDEPQHELMGQITHRLLETMRIPHLPFPETEDQISPTLEEAFETMAKTNLPFALVMREGSVAKEGLQPRNNANTVETDHLRFSELGPTDLTRYEALKLIREFIPEKAAVIATTGKTGRELYTIDDRREHFYVVGGMGTASGIGLGIAINSPITQPVVVIDGDGAALMKMGTLSTIGANLPENFLHIILDNEVHDSTGGQATVSGTTRFAQVAAAANYRNVCEISSAENLKESLRASNSLPGPTLIHCKISSGSISDLGRPKVTPVEVKERFMEFLNDGK